MMRDQCEVRTRIDNTFSPKQVAKAAFVTPNFKDQIIVGERAQFRSWPNQVLGAPAARVQGRSALHRTAEVWARKARRAVTDPKRNFAAFQGQLQRSVNGG